MKQAGIILCDGAIHSRNRFGGYGGWLLGDDGPTAWAVAGRSYFQARELNDFHPTRDIDSVKWNINGCFNAFAPVNG